MFEWISQNLATLVISVGLLLLIAWIVATMLRDRKNGKSVRCGGCSGCPMKGTCHKKEQ